MNYSYSFGETTSFEIEADSSYETEEKNIRFLGNITLLIDEISIYADSIITPKSQMSLSNNSSISGIGNITIIDKNNSIYIYGDSFSFNKDIEGKLSLQVQGKSVNFNHIINNLQCPDKIGSQTNTFVKAKKIEYFPFSGIIHIYGNISFNIDKLKHVGSYIEYDILSCRIIRSIY